MYCPNCGAKMPSEAKFCTNCGTKLDNNNDTTPDVETTIIDNRTPKKKRKRISPVVAVLLVIAVVDVLFSNLPSLLNIPSQLYVYSSRADIKSNANYVSGQKTEDVEKIVSIFEGRYIDLSDSKCYVYDVESRNGTEYSLFYQQINTLSAEYRVEIEFNNTNAFLSIQEKATNHEAVKITLRKASLMERIKYVMYLNAIL